MVSGQCNKVRIRDLSMPNDPSQEGRLIRDVIRPELMARISAHSVEGLNCLVHGTALPDEKPQQSPLSYWASREAICSVRKPLVRHPMVHVIPDHHGGQGV